MTKFNDYLIENILDGFERILYKTLKKGDTFYEIRPKSRPQDNNLIMVYKKETGSSAVCIDQKGYNNTRGVGSTYSFTSNKVVWVKKHI